MTPRRKAIFKVLLFLLAGAIINVAVAWGCALFVDLTTVVDWQVNSKTANGYEYLTAVIQKPGAAFVWFDSRTQTRDSSVYSTNRTVQKHVSLMKRVPMRTTPVPWFARATEGQLGERWLEARGWPALSLWCEYQNSNLNLVLGGIATNLEPQHRMWADTPAVIPFWVHGPGFAINTIFYTAIVWGLFFAPFAIRRRLRRKRGQCARCGYSLRGLTGDNGVCPECGATV